MLESSAEGLPSPSAALQGSTVTVATTVDALPPPPLTVSWRPAEEAASPGRASVEVELLDAPPPLPPLSPPPPPLICCALPPPPALLSRGC